MSEARPPGIATRRLAARMRGEPVPALARTSLRPAGRALLAAGLLVGLLAARSSAAGLLPLAAALLAPVGVSLLLPARLGRLTVTLEPPAAREVPRGTSLPLVLTATWAPGRGSRPPVSLAPRAPGVTVSPVAVPPLPAGTPHHGTATLAATARGHHTGLAVTVTDDGVLGLVRRTRLLALPLDLLVTPRDLGLADRLPPPRPGLGDEALTGGPAALRGPEPRGTREFRPGDEPRSVSWRATARTGRLTVREWDPPRGSGLGIVVQLAPDTAAPVRADRPAGSGVEADDTLLDVVASLGLAALAVERPVGLVHARPARPGEAETAGAAAGSAVVVSRPDLSRTGLLGALADVVALRTEGLDPLAAAAAGMAGPGGTVLLALGVGWGVWSAAELASAARTVAGAGCSLEILVGRSTDGPLPPGAAEAFGRARDNAAVTLAADLLPGAVPQAGRQPRVDAT